jgi:hypothetical protein
VPLWQIFVISGLSGLSTFNFLFDAMILKRLKIPKLPARTIAFFLTYLCVLLLYLLLVIYPQHLSLAEADLDIKKLKVSIEEQKILYPIFQDLLKKVRVKDTEALPFPKKAKLMRNETAKISSIFQEIAQKSNLVLKEIIPDADALISGAGYLKLNLTVKGNFLDLRNFMLQLGELPYLEHIERIQIRSVQDSKEISFKFFLAQE